MSIEDKEISKQFNKTKIIIPIMLGLFVSGILLYTNLNEVRFEKVSDGKGFYDWIDYNNDGVIQYSDINEFQKKNNGDYKKLTYIDILKQTNWTSYTFIWLILSFSMVVLRYFMYMYRIRMLSEKELSWKQSFNVVVVWEFASSLTPGVVGGAAVAMFILNREKINLGKATALVMITAIFDNLFFVLMIPLVYLMLGNSTFFPPMQTKNILGINLDVESIFWLAYVFVFIFLILLFISLIIKPKIIQIILNAIFSLPIIKKFKSKSIKISNEIQLASKSLKGKKFSYWYKPFLATAIGWTGRFMLINFIIQGFVSLDFIEHLRLYARGLGMWIIMLISPTPGGSGIAEYMFTVFLGEFTPVGMAIVFAIIWRLISYYPCLFIGAIVLPKWIRNSRTMND